MDTESKSFGLARVVPARNKKTGLGTGAKQFGDLALTAIANCARKTPNLRVFAMNTDRSATTRARLQSEHLFQIA